MKIYDTLINVPLDLTIMDSRERNGKIYAWCHEQNIISSKKGENKHYFVFSNSISNHHAICRSIQEPNEIGMTVSYEVESYKDFIVISGNNDENKNIDRLSTKKPKRFVFNSKTGSLIKKIIATSKSGKRHINIFKTEFFDVDITKYEPQMLHGIGGRITYGCGLIIPTNVYNHLMNFVQK